MKPSTMIIIAVLTTVASLQIASGDDDDSHFGNLFKRSADVAPVNNPLYAEECGGCHMAYPPGLLPGESWQAIMQGLQDHFGDNAELDPQTLATVSEYLHDNSADKSGYRRSVRILRSLHPGRAPLRITDIPYIRHEHDEIPVQMVKNNDKVGSLSHCNACHSNADKGNFSEREISIPGYAGWDD